MPSKSKRWCLKSKAEILSCDFKNNLSFNQAYINKVLKFQRQVTQVEDRTKTCDLLPCIIFLLMENRFFSGMGLMYCMFAICKCYKAK